MTINETALVTIAVAVSVQACVTLTVAVLGFRAWQRVTEDLERQLAVLHGELREVLPHVREAAWAVGRLTTESRYVAASAGRILGQVGDATDFVTAQLSAPHRLVAAGVMAGVKMLLNRRTRRNR